MNFFDGVLTAGAGSDKGQFEGEGLSAAGVRLVSSNKADGDKIRLGVRPQHLIPDPNGQLKGTVTLVERLGTETVVELDSESGTSFRCASPASLDIEIGQEVSFSLEVSEAHLF